MGNDVFYERFPIMNHKRMSRRRPTKSGAELGGGCPLESMVQLEGERLFGRLHILHLGVVVSSIVCSSCGCERVSIVLLLWERLSTGARTVSMLIGRFFCLHWVTFSSDITWYYIERNITLEMPEKQCCNKGLTLTLSTEWHLHTQDSCLEPLRSFKNQRMVPTHAKKDRRHLRIVINCPFSLHCCKKSRKGFSPR